MLETHNLLNILNLFVLHDLVVFRFSNIEKFAAQREHTEIVSANNTKASDGQGFGRVSFRKDQCAIFTMLCTSIVCVCKFSQPQEPGQ